MNRNENLEAEFNEAMEQLYEDAKALDIIATRFRNDVQKYGGVYTAHHYLSEGDPWTPSQLESVTKLIMARGGIRNLKYTVEALVLKPRFAPLFSNEQREKACERLKILDSFWECDGL